MQNLLPKIDRIASWILFVVIICYAITGFGMTKGFIDSDFSRTWHLGYLGIIGLVAFIIHTSWAAHLALKRKNLWNIFTKSFLVFFYFSLISFFCYLQFFYQESEKKDPPLNNATTEVSIVSAVFTAENLKQYNGLNGQPAYIAVDGIVYDVSSLFRNGQHEGCSAGQDVTSEFNNERRHNNGDVLEGYTIVGTYEN